MLTLFGPQCFSDAESNAGFVEGLVGNHRHPELVPHLPHPDYDSVSFVDPFNYKFTILKIFVSINYHNYTYITGFAIFISYFRYDIIEALGKEAEIKNLTQK